MDEASQPKSPSSKHDNDPNLLSDDLEPISPEDFDDGSDEPKQPQSEQKEETETNEIRAETTVTPVENESEKQTEMEVDEASQENENVNVNNVDGDVSMENQDEEGEKGEHTDDKGEEEKDNEGDENKDEEEKDNKGDENKDDEENKVDEGDKVDEDKSAEKDEENTEKDKEQTETENKDKDQSDDKDDNEHDKTTGIVESDTAENADVSMDGSVSRSHEPEEVNMESLPEAAKDKSMSEDPFDMLMSSSREVHNEGDDKSQPVSNLDETDEHDDTEADGGESAAGDKDKSAATSNAVSPSHDDNQGTYKTPAESKKRSKH